VPQLLWCFSSHGSGTKTWTKLNSLLKHSIHESCWVYAIDSWVYAILEFCKHYDWPMRNRSTSHIIFITLFFGRCHILSYDPWQLPERLLDGSQENQNTQFTNYNPNSLQIPILAKENLQLKVLVQGKKICFSCFSCWQIFGLFFLFFFFFVKLAKHKCCFSVFLVIYFLFFIFKIPDFTLSSSISQKKKDA